MSVSTQRRRRDRRKKTKILIIIICVLAVAAVVSVCFYNKSKIENVGKPLPKNQMESVENTEDMEDTTDIDGDIIVKNNVDDSMNDPILDTEGAQSTDIDASKADGSKESSFPYTLPGTELVVERFAGYDGIYIEDGSDSDISGVTAMILSNKGSTDVEYADITVKRDDVMMEFKASVIPPGATVVVQEANKQSYGHGTYSDFYAQVAYRDELEMSENQVKVEDNGGNSIKVTNITKKDIPCVRVFYKYYMEDEDVYVGGIAYTAKLTGLGAGESQVISPSHYAGSSSRIVMVRTYDTED